MLFIRTSRQLFVRGKNPPAALAALRAEDRMRASVRALRPARVIRVDQKLIGSVHRRPCASGGHRYGAVLHQKRVCTVCLDTLPDLDTLSNRA